MTVYSLRNPTRTKAFIYAGLWVADCPRPGCGNCVRVTPGQTMFHCTDRAGTGGCHLVVELAWDPNAQEIWDELQRRPIPGTRNWAPAGHRQAIQCGFPEGQTLAELREETDTEGGTR